MMTLNLVNQSNTTLPRTFLLKWTTAVVEKLTKADQKKVIGREMTVVFLRPKEAKKLNQQYRGRDYATDVLSFAGNGDDHLGDLAICPDVLKRQAKEHGLSFKAELAYMVLHGLLHLLGYDHEVDAKQAQKMFRLQDRIFKQLEALLR